MQNIKVGIPDLTWEHLNFVINDKNKTTSGQFQSLFGSVSGVIVRKQDPHISQKTQWKG